MPSCMAASLARRWTATTEPHVARDSPLTNRVMPDQPSSIEPSLGGAHGVEHGPQVDVHDAAGRLVELLQDGRAPPSRAGPSSTSSHDEVLVGRRARRRRGSRAAAGRRAGRPRAAPGSTGTPGARRRRRPIGSWRRRPLLGVGQRSSTSASSAGVGGRADDRRDAGPNPAAEVRPPRRRSPDPERDEPVDVPSPAVRPRSPRGRRRCPRAGQRHPSPRRGSAGELRRPAIAPLGQPRPRSTRRSPAGTPRAHRAARRCRRRCAPRGGGPGASAGRVEDRRRPARANARWRARRSRRPSRRLRIDVPRRSPGARRPVAVRHGAVGAQGVLDAVHVDAERCGPRPSRPARPPRRRRRAPARTG